MSDDTYDLVRCRGAAGGGCPYALPVDPGFLAALAAAVAASGWPEFLARKLGGPAHRHHRFQLAVSACANGCSRPQIADVGLIRASRPQIDPAACTGCGACTAACPDGAVSVVDGLAVIDRTACLACGRCVRACPTGTMSEAPGWRVLLGGWLGRRPRLADELPGLVDGTAALDVLEASLARYMAAWRPGLKLGDLVAAEGVGRFAARGRP